MTRESKIIFLHIPKTAGQSVRKGLERALGARAVDPLLSFHQTQGSCFENWDRYRVFAGHLNWTDLDDKPGDRFTFSILREPRERIGSFYFYLRAQAKKLPPEDLEKPENAFRRDILERAPADYFFDAEGNVRSTIRKNYDNFFTTYFATRSFQPKDAFFSLPDEEKLQRAFLGMNSLDAICTVDRLAELEWLLWRATGKWVDITGRSINSGPLERSTSRWDALDSEMGSSKAMKKLEKFCELDQVIYEKVASQPPVEFERMSAARYALHRLRQRLIPY